MKDSKTNTQKAGGHKVCPWWMAYFFDNPLRRLIHPPEKVLGPHVSRGASVLDFGCGFGHYSLGMARLTGASGHVVAADVQQKMLDKTMERARKAGLDEIIRPCCARLAASGRRRRSTLCWPATLCTRCPIPLLYFPGSLPSSDRAAHSFSWSLRRTSQRIFLKLRSRLPEGPASPSCRGLPCDGSSHAL